MLRIFFGNHKCASQWTTLIIERVCNEMAWKSFCAYQDEINKHGSLQQLIDKEKPDFLIIPESSKERIAEIKTDFFGFHIARDPRDIIVSCYFSHKKSHKISNYIPTLAHRKKLQELPKKEGIDYEISISKVFIENLYNWEYDYPNIVETKFEKITDSPQEEFENIFDFLGLFETKNNPLFSLMCYYNRVLQKLKIKKMGIRLTSYSKNQLAKTLKELSFQSLKKGETIGLGDTSNHYRKGVSGDWKNHLTPEQEQTIVAFFPDVLQKLNYTDE